MVLTERLYFSGILASTLLMSASWSNTLFVNSAFNAYYAILFSAILLIVPFCFKCIRQKSFPRIDNIVLTFSLMILFLCIHKLFLSSEIYYYTSWLSAYLLFVGSRHYLRNQMIKQDLNRIYVIFCWVECIFSLLQFLGIMKSLSVDFKVTGTFENPNVTAIIISLGLPLVINRISLERKTWWLFMPLFLMVITIILLGCRTALLILAISFVLKLQPWIMRKFSKVDRNRKIISVCLVFAFFLVCGISLFRMKEKSSQGRLFIAKQTCNLIVQNPLTGIGYGLFEKEYNLFQASQLQNGTYSPREKANVRWVFTAYNEFLEQWAQGGLFGFALFSCLVFCIVRSSFLQGNYKARSFAISLIVIMVFNFWVQAYPIFLISIIGIANLSSSTTEEKRINQLSRAIVICSIIIAFIGFCHYSVTTIYGQYNLQQWMIAKRAHKHPLIEDLQKLKPYIGTSSNYYTQLGYAQIKAKKIDEAIITFEEARCFTSNPSIYIGLSHCYILNGRTRDASFCKQYLKTLNINY